MKLIFHGKCRSKARLDGKVAIVTGANTGIGKVTAEDFAKRGCKVIMACRDMNKGESAVQEIKGRLQGVDKAGSIHLNHLDLSSFASVREFAEKIKVQEPNIHLLINNAGVMMCPRSLTDDGFELHFATNHLGHFLLTLLLLPNVINAQPSRIVNVASKIHVLCNSLKFDDLQLEKSYSPTFAYARSKLANILFTKELARRLKGTEVKTYSVHPGVVNTELSRHLDTAFFRGLTWLYSSVGTFFQKTPLQGAQTTLHCALEDGLTSGHYYEDCEPVRPTAIARNRELAKELWEKSVEWVGVEEDPLKGK